MCVCTKFVSLSKLGHMGSKTRSRGQIKGKPCEPLEVTVLIRFSSNFVRMFVSIKSGSLSKLGHVGSKTRSQGQIKGKPCEHSRGHGCDPILIQLGQNVCLYYFWVPFENGSHGIKK